MTYDEFIKKHKGVAVDFDGAAKAQCVDLATAYFYEVFNSKIKNFWFDAHHFWDLFDNNPWLKKNMTKIENKPETVPQKGDVAVWKGSLNGGLQFVQEKEIRIISILMTRTGQVIMMLVQKLSITIIILLVSLDQKTSLK